MTPTKHQAGWLGKSRFLEGVTGSSSPTQSLGVVPARSRFARQSALNLFLRFISNIRAATERPVAPPPPAAACGPSGAQVFLTQVGDSGMGNSSSRVTTSSHSPSASWILLETKSLRTSLASVAVMSQTTADAGSPATVFRGFGPRAVSGRAPPIPTALFRPSGCPVKASFGLRESSRPFARPFALPEREG
jgi:hypothetical protein